MSCSDEGYQPKNCKNGYDFEVWFQGFLNASGFDAKLTSGNDNGVDIIATSNVGAKEFKYYIQCKFRNRTISKAPIQEIYTGHMYFGSDGYPVVITNNRMTYEAKAYAKKLGVEVISEYELNTMQVSYKTKQAVNESFTGMLGRYNMSKLNLVNMPKVLLILAE